MNALDLDVLVAALDPDRRGRRRHPDDIADAIQQQVTHLEAAAIPELVLETIRRGEREGRWSTPRNASTTIGRTVMPKWILLPERTLARDIRRPVGVPLRSELASWAANLPLSTSQRELLVAVNDWLKHTNGGNVPIVAAAERAYEIVRDEKAFDAPQRGGATLWGPGRLTYALLRCERIATPLTWEPTVHVIGDPGPIVCVENHATFRTLLRVLREKDSPPWVAVGWVQGRNTAPLESLLDLPFRVTSLHYLGDLDAAGLSIAADACRIAEMAGIPAGPATRLWEHLVECSPRKGSEVAASRVHELVAWLPESVRSRATNILTQGMRIPQEALRSEILTSVIL